MGILDLLFKWITVSNYKQDAWADVQLLLFLNGGVVLLAGLAKRVLIDGMEPDVPGLWNDVYEVSVDFQESVSKASMKGAKRQLTVQGRRC